MLFSAGNVGYLISGIKVASEVHVGDTITSVENPGEALKGFEKVKPMVFAGIYPVDTTEFEELRVFNGKTATERCFIGVGVGNFGSARFWISMRFSRHAAHGNYSGKAGARVRHDRDHDCSFRSVQSISYR